MSLADEELVIGAIMVEPKWLRIVLKAVWPRHFMDPVLKRIFASMLIVEEVDMMHIAESINVTDPDLKFLPKLMSTIDNSSGSDDVWAASERIAAEYRAECPEARVSRVRDSVDIVDVIGRDVELGARGVNHLGLCPFHEESSPSLYVTRQLQTFHCFGCGEGGDVFTYIMRSMGVRFGEAVTIVESGRWCKA